MAKGNAVERTAINPFKLADQPVGKGQVVTLTQTQLRSLAAAGCVALTDEDNEDVPKRELPPTQGTIEASGPAGSDDGLDAQTVAQLKDLAGGEQIDLGTASTKADILTAIRSARTARV